MKLATRSASTLLGLDSPFFSTIVPFKKQRFPWAFGGFLERRIPRKNGNGRYPWNSRRIAKLLTPSLQKVTPAPHSLSSSPPRRDILVQAPEEPKGPNSTLNWRSKMRRIPAAESRSWPILRASPFQVRLSGRPRKRGEEKRLAALIHPKANGL